MRKVFAMRVWFSIGVLVLAAGMPYCSAALGWAATQDDYNVYIREDVAMGLIVAWIGWSILTVVFVAWAIRKLRARGTRAVVTARARVPSRA